MHNPAGTTRKGRSTSPSIAGPGLWKFTGKTHSDSIRLKPEPDVRCPYKSLHVAWPVTQFTKERLWQRVHFRSTDQELDSLLPLPSPPQNKHKSIKQTTRNYIKNLFLQMKFYLPTRARQPVLTTFLGRTRLRWCFARKEPTSWACRQDPVSTAPPSSAVFPAEHTPCMVSRAPVLPGSSRTDTQLCTWNFICFSRFDARPIIVVLKCIYVVKLKPTVILAMELRISEPASWIRHWFLLLCHNVNIFGINNTFIDLHPVVPKESSSVFPAPLHSVHCQKYPSSPVERSKVSGANDEASRPCWSSVVLFVPHHYSNATAAIQKHRVQKAARVMLGSPNSGSQNKWGGHRRHSKLSPCPPLDSALSHPRSNPSSQEMPN